MMGRSTEDVGPGGEEVEGLKIGRDLGGEAWKKLIFPG
jgi:hypothetical protein